MRVGSLACCSGLRRFWTLCMLAAAVALVAFIAGRWSAPGLPMPTVIDASGSVTGGEFSVATGMVGEEAEGFFVLDHATGLLQCNVLYPRMGRFMAGFTANVKEQLPGGGKGGGYLMVTGFADFPSGSNRLLTPGAVVYVIDTSTGAYACYGVPFNRVASTAGQQQGGRLIVIGLGQARPLIDRDALR